METSEVLVVDDVGANLVAMQALLSELDVRCDTASSGTEALRRLLQHDYSVVLLDVHMPGMDGYETASLIRSRPRSSDLPIVFVTARDASEADISRGYQVGAADYLFKPVVPDVLRAKVMTFVRLDRARRRAERQASQIQRLEQEAGQRRISEARERWERERLLVENQRKDEFLAMLAHELRNPLAPLRAGLALLNGADPEQRADAIVRMERQVHHLSRFVDDLLDVARLSNGKIHLEREHTVLEDAVEHALQGVEPKIAERGQHLTVDLERGVGVFADEVRLVQVVNNLLSNAIRYTPEGGEIRVVTGRQGPHAFLKVSDNGRGIDPDMIETIFDTFIQERDSGEGLGLGLALVRRLVELHQGRVEVHSEGRGEGSTFVIWLPLAEPPAAAPEDPASADDVRAEPAESPDASNTRVLVIDDNEDVRMLTGMLIESWGFDVLDAPDGQTGVALAAQHRPAVAIVDISMPGMSGYEVADAIRQQLGDASPRMIAVTGFSDAATQERIVAHGFDGYLVKPADPDQLRTSLMGAT